MEYTKKVDFILRIKKIKLYAKDKRNLPKENSNITIIKAQLGFYRDNPQVIIHDKSQYNVN